MKVDRPIRGKKCRDSYTGAGAFSSQTDYYSIAGHLISSTNSTTTYDLTDAEGSVLTTLSSSAVLGEQIYGPYGNQRYTQGSIGTDKGYTGQFQDAVSGFDYYNARYYDPVMGQFLSADNVQGNAQGMDPYSYVNGNPETATDPTGQRISCPPDCDTSGGIPTAVHPGSGLSGGSGGSLPIHRGGIGSGSSGSAPVLLIAHMPKGMKLPTNNTSSCPNEMKGPNCNINEEGICAGYTNADPTCQQKQITAACKGDQTCLTCNDNTACIGQHHASDIAQNVVLDLGILAGFLAIVGTILAGIGSAMTADIAGIVPGAWLIGIGIGLGILGVKAGTLAYMFAQEGSSSEGGLSWFTKNNLASEENTMDGMLATFTLPSLTGGGVGAIVEEVLAKTLPNFAKLMPGIGGGMIITDAVGSVGLMGAVEAITNEQEADGLT